MTSQVIKVDNASHGMDGLDGVVQKVTSLFVCLLPHKSWLPMPNWQTPANASMMIEERYHPQHNTSSSIYPKPNPAPTLVPCSLSTCPKVPGKGFPSITKFDSDTHYFIAVIVLKSNEQSLTRSCSWYDTLIECSVALPWLLVGEKRIMHREASITPGAHHQHRLV